jgi:hypothetical protein
MGKDQVFGYPVQAEQRDRIALRFALAMVTRTGHIRDGKVSPDLMAAAYAYADAYLKARKGAG